MYEVIIYIKLIAWITQANGTATIAGHYSLCAVCVLHLHVGVALGLCARRVFLGNARMPHSFVSAGQTNFARESCARQ
jgi:hypothetical protein